MATTVLKVGDTLKIGNYLFRVRKVNKKDVIIREVKPTVKAHAQAKTQAKAQAQDGKEVTEEKATEEDMFEKTF